MTLRELSQLYYLNREIELDKSRIEELRAKAEDASRPITGMPGSRKTDNRVERYVAELVDLEAIIAAKQVQCVHEHNRLVRYIDDIDDSLTRQVFKLRFEKGLTWQEIAAKTGHKHSWKGLSNICYRYLKKHPK
ncbi:hypothetical protein LJB90_03395 [Eubacteriales bacterium OttesenSCG-928-G02]|nr:hypothetical protein [Eubacteriales bacterium OttesenSCG-928-G02]